jgi:hypothetical protein
MRLIYEPSCLALLVTQFQGLAQVQHLPTQKASLLKTAAVIQEKALKDFLIRQTAMRMHTDRNFVQPLPLLIAKQDGLAEHCQLSQVLLNLSVHGASLRARKHTLAGASL